jgi:hypothetical protein
MVVEHQERTAHHQQDECRGGQSPEIESVRERDRPPAHLDRMEMEEEVHEDS